MTRKTASIVLFAAMLLAIIAIPAIFRSNAFAATKSAEFVIGLNKYFVNDQLPGVNMDAAPYIDSGRTLVPVRYLADALGVTDSNIQWNPVTQQVYLVQGNTTIDLVIGSTALTVNGQASQMDVAPVIKDGRTYLPARWVANALGYQVDWNAQYEVVIIWPNGTQEPDYGNVTKRAQQKPTVVNGFNIPAGTHLGIATDTRADMPMDFAIDTTKGDTQGQLADAQNILSQAKYLDPATVTKIMAVINYDLTGQRPQKQGGINSPNGGSVIISPYGNVWCDIEIWSTPQPAGMLITN